ncbi:rCG52030 [Rattus norvegicus]|uniref:RCG52030 n=1 Tax=Rattus norvegicus TaxID=10116 RepID=A6K373_RAT|nr:rCG52030 [Rattus norvegicus]
MCLGEDFMPVLASAIHFDVTIYSWLTSSQVCEKQSPRILQDGAEGESAVVLVRKSLPDVLPLHFY